MKFETALRIGASRSTQVDEPDLPVLRDALGRPYIPGSSFKGALRSYTEAVLRTLQARPEVSDKNLACLSVGKPARRPAGEEPPHVCLHQNEVDGLKSALGSDPPDWSKLPEALRQRLPGEEDLKAQARRSSSEATLDRALRDLSCWACRVFGAQWLAAKALLRDLPLQHEQDWPREVRNGVAIDRDAGRAFPGQLYDLEVLPAGATFDLEILIENATPQELGLLWLGLGAFERGEIPLGGARSRGLGWCRLEPDWSHSQYIDASNLLDSLFSPERLRGAEQLGSQPALWVRAFGEAIGAIPAGGGRDA